MTIDNNPFEAALERYIDVDKDAEYMCRDALLKLRDEGPARRLVNLFIDGEDLPPMRSDWPVRDAAGKHIGIVTSKVWSLKFGTNIAFAIVNASHMAAGNTVTVDADGELRLATVKTDTWGDA